MRRREFITLMGGGSVGMTLVGLAAAIEAITGLFLIISPSLLVWLLLGAELSSPGQALGRVAGFALLALACACWPRKTEPSTAAPALAIYNVLTTIYLFFLGIGGELVGVLLWPAVAMHAGLAILLLRTRLFSNRAGSLTVALHESAHGD